MDASRMDHEWLAAQFEAQRTHLRSVAYRMLGSLSDADDAVQASWLRVSRAETNTIQNLGGWLTTVVARVCLDMLRARKSRRTESLDADVAETLPSHTDAADPEHEAQLADSVGLALLVVLDMLNPDERLTYVLHDVFAVPFEEIAPIVRRSPEATRQLASRARRRIQGTPSVPSAELARQTHVVEAFLAASRAGDFDALLAVLHPDVVFRADAVAMPSGIAFETHGAQAVAKQFRRRGSAQGAQPALVGGQVGIVVAPRGRLMLVLRLTFMDGWIAAIEAIADPADLNGLELAALGNE